jgi:hypothetical protein
MKGRIEMNLVEMWQERFEKQNDSKARSDFITKYYELETVAYKTILAERRYILEGTLADLAAEAGMDAVTFIGFLEGINTSITIPLVLADLGETSEIRLEIIPEKLFYNMLAAKANWLYGLPEWDDILSEEVRRDIRRQYGQDHRATSEKVGRNDPCPCGSGKKYKKCCGANA